MHNIIDKLLALLDAARNAGPRIEAALKDRLETELGKLHDEATVLKNKAEAEAQRLEQRAEVLRVEAAKKAETVFEKLYALADKHGVEV